jgi:BlaI family penicillinase repressor
MNNLASKISDSELEVLKILWEKNKELTIAEIRKALQLRSQWDYSTIKTLLRRLCEKGVVASKKEEVYYFSPLVSLAEYNDYTTQTLINRLYSGSAKNLVASLIGNHKLNDGDIRELREMFKVGANNE